MKRTHSVIVLSFLVTVCLNGVICSYNFVLYSRIKEFDTHTCPLEHSDVITNIPSKTKCLHLCTEATTCQGVFHEPDTLKCLKCSVETYVTTTTATNSIFYKRQVEGVDEGAVFGDFTYKLVVEKMSWNSAKQNCEQLGGCLTSVTSSEEQTFIVNVVMASHPWGTWIGGSRTAGDASSFKWVDGTDLAAGYVNWDTTRPIDNPEENCVKVSKRYNYHWITLDCEGISYSVCKFG